MCESATNELPLSSISFAKWPKTPNDTIVTKPNFTEYNSENGISPVATNERPLSCTCLPKLLSDNQNLSVTSIQCDDEFFDAPTNIYSSSDPMPHSNYFEQCETQSFSQHFIERLNDFNKYRDRKSMLPKILINNNNNRLNKIHETNNIVDSKTSLSSYKCLLCACDHPNEQCSKITIKSSLDASNVTAAISITSNSNSNKIVNNKTIPHPILVKTHNSDATQSTTISTTRRQRHSIAGQMGFFKIMDIAGGFSRKMATSTNSLFSTAVISGSSSAPNLRDMIPNTASPSGIV